MDKELIRTIEELFESGNSKDEMIDQLEVNNRTREEAKQILFKIDDLFTQSANQKIEAEQSNNRLIIGVIILGIGLLVSLGTFLNGNKTYLLAWGAILYGMYLIRNSQSKRYQKQTFIKKGKMFDR